MKIFAQILLIIVLEIAFVVGLASVTVKFQLLEYDFWSNSFQKYDTYQKLADVSKDSFEAQIDKEGGSRNDIKVLTDLVNVDNVKDTVDQNLQNFLVFANGGSGQINVYLPIDKIPKNLLSKNISGLKTQMTLQELLVKFNFQDWQNLPISELSQVGAIANFLIVISSLSIVFILILLVLLVEKGFRFVGLGVAFFLAGGFTLLASNIMTSLNNALSSSLVNSSSLAVVFGGTLIPPIVEEISHSWLILSLVLFAIGTCLFFIKKQGYNDSR